MTVDARRKDQQDVLRMEVLEGPRVRPGTTWLVASKVPRVLPAIVRALEGPKKAP